MRTGIFVLFHDVRHTVDVQYLLNVESARTRKHLKSSWREGTLQR